MAYPHYKTVELRRNHIPVGLFTLGYTSHPLEYDPNAYIPITGCCNGSRVHLYVTYDDFESFLVNGRTLAWLADQLPPYCGWWLPSEPRNYRSNKRVAIRDFFNIPPEDPSRWALLPGTHSEGTNMVVPAWKKSHLLSLPKELRLEIWKWTLTDPSVPELVVNIGREKKEAYQHSATGPVVPRVITWLEPRQKCGLGLGLLQTNRFIYEEALPLLYRSVRFALVDHLGIFPLFLGSLSTHARSLIRHIKLQVPRQIYDIDIFGDPAMPLFHWAVTCAQVATLSGQLRDVEVEGLFMDSGFSNASIRRSILFPLCKIKTRKLFGKINNKEADSLLASAEQELEVKVALRKERAEAEAVADGSNEPESAESASEDGDNLTIMPSVEVFKRGLTPHMSQLHIGEGSSVDDIDTLLEDWDVISYKSGASTPRC
ncbi:hypothetical protein BU23DRAFT_603089 [Bimuria novae-zelandiae CBS 107.79]|uniref:DUF7730 domain-containing protein n=1 Tax=Bimuria novae-zelandiae CBS 107.79 TaxID=1447943 RepID=A0A6A5UQW7_9PLEO|nr:hypothetical protein BU23DRAFT_603089 [Bimuria novae-zelandiae CBS 107.79]